MPKQHHVSVDTLERIRSEHETSLFNQIVFQAKDVKLEPPGTEFMDAKELFRKKKSKDITGSDRNSLMAGMGSPIWIDRNSRDQDMLISSGKSVKNKKSELRNLQQKVA
jgi:hypothetical protein